MSLIDIAETAPSYKVYQNRLPSDLILALFREIMFISVVQRAVCNTTLKSAIETCSSADVAAPQHHHENRHHQRQTVFARISHDPIRTGYFLFARLIRLMFVLLRCALLDDDDTLFRIFFMHVIQPISFYCQQIIFIVSIFSLFNFSQFNIAKRLSIRWL